MFVVVVAAAVVVVVVVAVAVAVVMRLCLCLCLLFFSSSFFFFSSSSSLSCCCCCCCCWCWWWWWQYFCLCCRCLLCSCCCYWFYSSYWCFIVVIVVVVIRTQCNMFYRYLSAGTRRVYMTSSCQSWLVKLVGNLISQLGRVDKNKVHKLPQYLESWLILTLHLDPLLAILGCRILGLLEKSKIHEIRFKHDRQGIGHVRSVICRLPHLLSWNVPFPQRKYSPKHVLMRWVVAQVHKISLTSSLKIVGSCWWFQSSDLGPPDLATRNTCLYPNVWTIYFPMIGKLLLPKIPTFSTNPLVLISLTCWPSFKGPAARTSSSSSSSLSASSFSLVASVASVSSVLASKSGSAYGLQNGVCCCIPFHHWDPPVNLDDYFGVPHFMKPLFWMSQLGTDQLPFCIRSGGSVSSPSKNNHLSEVKQTRTIVYKWDGGKTIVKALHLRVCLENALPH